MRIVKIQHNNRNNSSKAMMMMMNSYKIMGLYKFKKPRKKNLKNFITTHIVRILVEMIQVSKAIITILKISLVKLSQLRLISLL